MVDQLRPRFGPDVRPTVVLISMSSENRHCARRPNVGGLSVVAVLLMYSRRSSISNQGPFDGQHERSIRRTGPRAAMITDRRGPLEHPIVGVLQLFVGFRLPNASSSWCPSNSTIQSSSGNHVHHALSARPRLRRAGQPSVSVSIAAMSGIPILLWKAMVPVPMTSTGDSSSMLEREDV